MKTEITQKTVHKTISKWCFEGTSTKEQMNSHLQTITYYITDTQTHAHTCM